MLHGNTVVFGCVGILGYLPYSNSMSLGIYHGNNIFLGISYGCTIFYEHCTMLTCYVFGHKLWQFQGTILISHSNTMVFHSVVQM